MVYRARGVKMGVLGWGGVTWVAWRRSWPCTRFYTGIQFKPPTRFPIPDPSLAPFTTGYWESSSANHPWVGFCDRDCNSTVYPAPYLRNWFSLFTAMNWLNCASTTRAYLPIIMSTERTNGKTCFCWLLQLLPRLSFLIVLHQSRSSAIGPYL